MFTGERKRTQLDKTPAPLKLQMPTPKMRGIVSDCKATIGRFRVSEWQQKRQAASEMAAEAQEMVGGEGVEEEVDGKTEGEAATGERVVDGVRAATGERAVDGVRAATGEERVLSGMRAATAREAGVVAHLLEADGCRGNSSGEKVSRKGRGGWQVGNSEADWCMVD